MWTCGHCTKEIEDKYDYCGWCEYCGCTLDDHRCVCKCGSTDVEDHDCTGVDPA